MLAHERETRNDYQRLHEASWTGESEGGIPLQQELGTDLAQTSSGPGNFRLANAENIVGSRLFPRRGRERYKQERCGGADLGMAKKGIQLTSPPEKLRVPTICLLYAKNEIKYVFVPGCCGKLAVSL